ncbi:MAG: tetratricopeptide repeat protein [Planctomyces sp.]|nr:tetratricopeptide repeat protein [Planctomyces sp.]
MALSQQQSWPGRMLSAAVLIVCLVVIPSGVKGSLSLAQEPTRKASSAPQSEPAPAAKKPDDALIDEARNHLRNNLPAAASLAKQRLVAAEPLTAAQRAELLWIAGSALSIMGDHVEALQLLEEGVQLAEAPELIKLRRRLLRYVAASAGEVGKAERGAAAAREALLISKKLNDSSDYVGLLHNELAGNESRMGNFQVAIEEYHKALEIVRETGNVRQRSMILTNLANVFSDLKQHNEAITLLTEARQIALDNKLNPVLAASEVALGNSHLAMKNVVYARRFYELARDRCEQPGLQSMLAAAEVGLGDAALQQNQVEEARIRFERANEIYTQVQDPSGVITVQNRLVALRQKETEVSEVLKSLEESLKKAEEIGDVPLMLDTSRQLAAAYQNSGDFRNASRMLEKAMELQQVAWSLGHAEKLAETMKLLDMEKIVRLQDNARIQQESIARQRQRNLFLLIGLLASILMLLVLVKTLSDRKRAIHRLRNAEAEIRQQKQLQIAMERRLAEQQRTESLGIMAAGIAHDFNNLLTAISGFAEVGSVCAEDERTSDLFRQITTVTFQAADLTTQLRQFMGKPNEDRTGLDLRQVVESARTLLNSVARPNAVIEIADGHETLIAAIDDAQFRQTLLNLVTNAVDSVPDENGRLTVKLASCTLSAEELESMKGSDLASPGEFCCLEVTDNGPGIQEDVLKRIFDPYFSTKAVGRGLGLASVLGITRSCRGALKVLSKAGEGTTFSVYIPRVTPSAVAAVSQAACPPEPLRKMNEIQGAMVLLVDDEALIRNSISEVLTAAGYEVVTASDSYSAMALIPKIADRLNVAIVDYSMPGETGVRLAERLNERIPGLPVIICSGYAAESIPTGEIIRRFLQKPYVPSELLDEVRRCVNTATFAE